jgi:hypothetical protein
VEKKFYMDNKKDYIARPVEKTPARRWDLYVKRICSECGLIHLYRKIDEKKNPVRYGCVKNFQLWLLGEEATIKQERLL